MVAAAVCAGCHKQPSPTVFLDPALAVLVPPDTKLLAGVRMERLKATPFYKEYVADSPRLQEFRKQTGLAEDADVWEYLIAFDGKESLTLLRGKFTEMGMEPRINKPSARRLTHQGVSILGDDEGAIAFLNPTTAVAGTFAAVRQALDERHANTGVPEALLQLTQKITSEHDAWLASTGPAPGFLSTSLIRYARIGFVPKSAQMDLELEALSGQAAISLAEIVNGRVEGNRVVAHGTMPSAVRNWMLGLK